MCGLISVNVLQPASVSASMSGPVVEAEYEDDPLALSDDDEQRRSAPVRAMLRGGANDGDSKQAGSPANAGGRGSASGNGSGSAGSLAFDEKSANEGGGEDSSLLVGSNGSGGRGGGAGGGGGGGGGFGGASSGHDVKEIMLLYEHQQKMGDGFGMNGFLTFKVCGAAHSVGGRFFNGF